MSALLYSCSFIILILYNNIEFGNPAVWCFHLRPVALRPYFSIGLLLTVFIIVYRKSNVNKFTKYSYYIPYYLILHHNSRLGKLQLSFYSLLLFLLFSLAGIKGITHSRIADKVSSIVKP